MKSFQFTDKNNELIVLISTRRYVSYFVLFISSFIKITFSLFFFLKRHIVFDILVLSDDVSSDKLMLCLHELLQFL